MNYTKIYQRIIRNRQQDILIKGYDQYTELHHIVPKSLGGSDYKENLVRLTAREHYICHLLLTKMYTEGSFEWIKMIKAFSMLAFTQCDNQSRYISGRKYERFKKDFSKAQSLNQSGKNNSQYGKVWISNSETKKTMKVSTQDIDSFIKLGWFKGRVLNWDRFSNKKCSNCDEALGASGDTITLEGYSFCKRKCRSEFKKSLYIKNKPYGVLSDRKDEFLSLYESGLSMNKTLKEMGYPGAISHWYKSAKKILDDRELPSA